MYLVAQLTMKEHVLLASSIKRYTLAFAGGCPFNTKFTNKLGPIHLKKRLSLLIRSNYRYPDYVLKYRSIISNSFYMAQISIFLYRKRRHNCNQSLIENEGK